MASKSKEPKKTSKKKAVPAKKPTVKKPAAKKTAAKKTVSKKVAAPLMRPCDKFNNRELSWLEFNNRILHEARDTKNPLLERLNFLAITASNLDEFYIVRVASLRDMASVNFEEKDLAGLTVNEQLRSIDDKTRKLMTLMYSTYSRSLVPSLKQENIFISDYDELDERMQEHCDDYFTTELYPVLTPMAVDQSRPFPLIYNRRLNLCVMLDGKGLVASHNKNDEDNIVYATLQVPNVVPRLFKLVGENGEIVLVPIETIIRANLDMLFTSQKVLGSACYRVMRNADLDIDEDEAEDLLKEIEEQVRKRRYGEIIRLEVEDDIDPDLLDYIITELKISKNDIFSVGGPIDLTFLSKVNGLVGKENFNELRYPAHDPAAPSMFDESLDNIFDQIKKKDRLVHHPYESFEPVLELVKQAARDPQVLAIKQTLYRVSDESPIIASLLEAANNGKQVMVLVELKARFDEQNNINWAKKLENAGCHVIYGLVGLKTHSKITLVVRKEEDGIRRYLHLATGNYNDITAKIYTDIGLFTASESFGEDASEFFNMLSGYSIPSTWRKLVAAPIWMKDYFIRNIRREAANAAEGKPATPLLGSGHTVTRGGGDHGGLAMDNLEKTIRELRAEIDALREECGRTRDRQLIENLVARYQYYFAAGLGERIVDELWAHEVSTVSNEFGASGVYRGLRKVKTYYQKDIVPGRFQMHTMTTPAIEIAGDRKTARGVWMSIGADTDAGDLGPEPVTGYEQRRLLSSTTADGKRFKAEWVWQKFEIEFIRESDGWKIWHLHGYDVFRCPYDENWVTYAEKRFQTDGLGIDAIYTKNIPYGPDEPPENNASVPTTVHWQYTVDAAPVLAPEPPEPYETMDTDFSWPMMP